MVATDLSNADGSMSRQCALEAVRISLPTVARSGNAQVPQRGCRQRVD